MTFYSNSFQFAPALYWKRLLVPGSQNFYSRSQADLTGSFKLKVVFCHIGLSLSEASLIDFLIDMMITVMRGSPNAVNSD